MRPWILAETNYANVSQVKYEVAVLPFGATEPHNLHLPYGTDTFEADAIATLACEAAWKQDAKVFMLPTLPYGTETNMAKCALAMNVNPSTIGLVIRDLVESLSRHGIKKVVLLNGHGGNEFKPLIRELMGQTSSHLFLCNWFRELTADVQPEIFDDPGDHAGEMETSLGLAYFGHLVRRNDDGSLAADEGSVKPARLRAIQRGWVNLSRPWHLLTTNTGCGNPHPASAQKGEMLMQVMVDRLSSFLVELAASELDETFPF
ncbi:creatininase family protein [Novipirellula artificiosorum]|uniref:Creatinine amidohydrolase n=1 Tax=Novipirellula artificiosorum TaxID=2528016 RepID=A0A5C6DAS7_9BACT|nr:creatininase family protein [Novipirellula artificiosorum]TWU32837.1 Creatinine amidohydrolase [Novipirellula artificiosorum]